MKSPAALPAPQPTRMFDTTLALNGLTLALALAIAAGSTAAVPGGARTLGEACVVSTLAVGVCMLVVRGRMAGWRTKLAQAFEARRQADELFGLTDMLQSAESSEDAAQILLSTCYEMMPDVGVALYIFNEAGDELALAASGSMPTGCSPAPTLAPSNCWALKRGRAHLNNPGTGKLCCSHHSGNTITLEIPMQARGNTYGLVKFVADGPGAARRLVEIAKVGGALADSFSLALANVQLRTKLHQQSLRDPLTGLYNRGYFDEIVAKYRSLSRRTEQPFSVVMIDLDHFKSINDRHGHACGDEVLREAARVLQTENRVEDIACRYGGEELALVLPNCPLDEAAAKAERIRARIEGLSRQHGFPITASFGVSSYPETASQCDVVLRAADHALYQAKELGRNRVECAQPVFAG